MGKTFEEIWAEMTGQQHHAFHMKVWGALGDKEAGEENMALLMAGKRQLRLEEVIQLLVDRHGRCIPQPEVTAAVRDANTDNHFGRLPDNMDDAAFLLQWERLFGQPSGLTADEFVSRIRAIKSKVATWPTAEKPQIANLLNGPHFPVILPQLPSGDYGTTLETILLPIVERAYTEAFPDRKFVNYRKNDLVKKVTIVDERHQRWIADLTKGPVVGIIYYPLQGFSVQAQRQMANLFPDFISLMGPVEASVATALYPKSIARDVHTPVQDCSAVQWRDSEYSLYFDADDDKLGFGGRANLGIARDCCSGGLFIRG